MKILSSNDNDDDDVEDNSFSSLHLNLVKPYTSEWKKNALFFPLHLLALNLCQFRKAITNTGWGERDPVIDKLFYRMTRVSS